jgi:hypothetical protein
MSGSISQAKHKSQVYALNFRDKALCLSVSTCCLYPQHVEAREKVCNNAAWSAGALILEVSLVFIFVHPKDMALIAIICS